MYKYAIAVVLAVSLWAGAAQAGEGFELGVIVIDPTGLTVKAWMSNTTAADFAVGWPHDGTYLHADYLFHDLDALRADSCDIWFYYGLGARAVLWDSGTGKDDEFGVRVPLGLCFIPHEAPLDFFIEIVPRIDLAPESDFNVDFAIGLRFMFR